MFGQHRLISLAGVFFVTGGIDPHQKNDDPAQCNEPQCPDKVSGILRDHGADERSTRAQLPVREFYSAPGF